VAVVWIYLPLARLVRVVWLIRCTPVPRINHIAPINHIRKRIYTYKRCITDYRISFPQPIAEDTETDEESQR
jgi:hypothetical protein